MTKTNLKQIVKDAAIGQIPGAISYNLYRAIADYDQIDTIGEKIETAAVSFGHGGFADLGSTAIGYVALKHSIEGNPAAQIGLGLIIAYRAISNILINHTKKNVPENTSTLNLDRKPVV